MSVALLKSVHGRAKKTIMEIAGAENKAEARKAVKEFGMQWLKAVDKITSDEETLLAYYDYPAEHLRHLRTTNPMECPVRR